MDVQESKAVGTDTERAAVIASIRKAYGDKPSAEQIRAHLEELGYTKSSRYCNVLRREISMQKQLEAQALLDALSKSLPMNPTRNQVEKRAGELGVPLSTWQLNKTFTALRAVPALWNAEKSLMKKITLTSSVDAQILTQLEAATGLPASACVALVLRVFILATGRHQVDLIEIVKAAREINDPELAQHVRLLTRLDLRGICK